MGSSNRVGPVLVPLMSRGAMWLPNVVFPSSHGNNLRFQFTEIGAEWGMIEKVYNRSKESLIALLTPQNNPAKYTSGDLQRRRNKPVKPQTPRDVVLPPDCPNIPPEAMIGEGPQDDEGHQSTAGGLAYEVIAQAYKAINVKASGVPYQNLSEDQSNDLSLDTFRDSHLGIYFSVFGYTTPPKAEDWRRVRDLLFPPSKGEEPKYNQGWNSLKSHLRVREMRKSSLLQKNSAYENFRIVAVRVFDSIAWFPLLTADKLHNYTLRAYDQRTKFRIAPGNIAAAKRGVNVVINPDMKNFKVELRTAGCTPVLDTRGEAERTAAREAFEAGLREHTENAPAVHRVLAAVAEDGDEAIGAEDRVEEIKACDRQVAREAAALGTFSQGGRIPARVLHQMRIELREEEEEGSEDEEAQPREDVEMAEEADVEMILL
ncbi:hypothetical protein CPB85DRAFT_1331480, partial [Mucidula mucida]